MPQPVAVRGRAPGRERGGEGRVAAVVVGSVRLCWGILSHVVLLLVQNNLVIEYISLLGDGHCYGTLSAHGP